MKFVKAAPNSSGAYQGPRSVPFPGCLPLTDGQAETLVAYNGFVTITREPDPEIEGLQRDGDPRTWRRGEAWTAAQPRARPGPPWTTGGRDQAAVRRGLRLYEGDLSNG